MVSLLFSLLLTTPASSAVFGIDDRERLDPTSGPARSVAISVLSTNMSTNANGTLKLETEPLSAFLCKDEKFANELSLTYACTGFLVAPDLIATAGHCMVNTGESRGDTDLYCKAFSWLFDYGHDPVDAVPQEKLYRCKEVIYAVKDETLPFRDYALIRLERPATDRKPLQLSSRPPRTNEVLSMIGHPLGIPATLSKNGKVLRDSPQHQQFVTNLDAQNGNSGSPVFNDEGEVIGILSGGTPSELFMKDRRKSCERYNRCDENASHCLISDEDPSIFPNFQRVGTEVQRITPVNALIKSLSAN